MPFNYCVIVNRGTVHKTASAKDLDAYVQEFLACGGRPENLSIVIEMRLGESNA